MSAYRGSQPHAKRALLLFLVLVLALTPLAGCGKSGGGKKKASEPSLGSIGYKSAGRDAAISTKSWGWVAADRFAVMTKTGVSRAKAEAAAKAAGGTICGEIELVGLYQVSVDAKDESALKAAMDKAAGSDGIDAIMPEQVAFMDLTAAGVECSVIRDDPVYAGENARPYEMTGVENAWKVIKAAGIPLSGVSVGVVDDDLLRGNGEFDGQTPVESENAEDDQTDASVADDAGRPEPYGTHGTAVTGIIAANADNGGQTGVASVLGSKLSVTHANIFGNRYGADVTTTPDPADPTKVTTRQGTYSIGALVALANQVKSGATVINCSWGATDANPVVAAAYRRFFEKMSQERPNVLFVCSAGNDGKSLDGKRRYPSGAALPNMITVGCVDNDGSKVDYSNEAGDDYEVTLAAPGHRVVAGVGADGRVSNIDGGTSFATPQVTAAAAMLRSLNPALTAGDIKKLLSDSATKSFKGAGGAVVQVPAGLGAGVVNIEAAVLKVVNDLRAKDGKSALTMDDVKALGGLDLSATSEDGSDWTVKATARSVREGGADLIAKLVGQGAIGGNTRKRLTEAGSASWSVTPQGSAAFHVKRSDSGSCWRVDLSSIAGEYVGKFAMPIEVSGGGSTTQDVPITILIADDGVVKATGAFDGPVALPGAQGGQLIVDTDLTLNGALTGMNVKANGTWVISATVKVSGLSIPSGRQSAQAVLTGTVNAGSFSGTLDVEGTKVTVNATKR